MFLQRGFPFGCKDGRSSWLAVRGAGSHWPREEKRRAGPTKDMGGQLRVGELRPPQRPCGDAPGLVKATSVSQV